MNHPLRHLYTSIFSILYFTIIFGGIYFILLKFEEKNIKKIVNSFEKSIQTDLSYLKVQGDEVSKNPILIEALLSEDRREILSILLGEKNLRSIGLMGVTNANGYIITRTKTITQTGEHAFVTSPQGRALDSGREHTESIEVSSFDPHQVLMTTGRKIYNEGKMIGALFSNYLLDDKYAKDFKNKYFTENAIIPNIIFYTSHFGPYGSSFDDRLKLEINSYLNLNPQMLTSPTQSFRFSVNDSNYYIKKIPFIGLEGNDDTGVLIFIETYTFAQKIIITVLMGILILILYLFAKFLINKSQNPLF